MKFKTSGIILLGVLLIFAISGVYAMPSIMEISKPAAFTAGTVQIAFLSFLKVVPEPIVSISRFFVNPYVRTVLLIIGMVGLLLEVISMTAIAGSIGLIALVLFFGSHIVLGLAPWWIVPVFLVGLVFLGLEIFVIPGNGVTGIIGIVSVLISMFYTINNPTQAAVSLVISSVVSIGIFVAAFKYLPKSRLFSHFMLKSEETTSKGFSTSKPRLDLEGAVGVAVSDLRPAGVALINDERIDVVTRGEYIKKDSPVRVEKVENVRVIVSEVEGTW